MKPERYGAPAIALHWTIAVLIAGAFGLGWIMTDIPGFTPTKLRYFAWHKWLGVTIFAIALLRLLNRLRSESPALPSHMPRWQQRAANGMHHLLYLLMFVIPLTGYFYSSAAGIQVVYLQVVPLPLLIAPDAQLAHWLKTGHVWLNWSMAGLVGLHALAAIKHQLIDRDGTLARMLPFLPGASRRR